MKAFTKAKSNIGQVIGFGLNREKSFVTTGENASYKHFLCPPPPPPIERLGAYRFTSVCSSVCLHKLNMKT